MVDAGHAMESLWFAMEAGSLLDEKSWKQRAEEVLDWVIERCYDESYGGFIQHIDVDMRYHLIGILGKCING